MWTTDHRFPLARAVALGAIALAAACATSSSAPPDTAEEPPPADTQPADTAGVDSVPTAAAPTTAEPPPEPTAEPPTAVAAAADPLAATPGQYNGWKLFHVYCYRCHGTDAIGSDIAPNLRESVGPTGAMTHDLFVQTVMEGRPAKGMPAWESLLSREQVEDLWAYVKARSEGTLAAGRPHVANGES